MLLKKAAVYKNHLNQKIILLKSYYCIQQIIKNTDY